MDIIKKEYYLEYRQNYYNENIEQLILNARIYKRNKKIWKEKVLYQKEYYNKYKDLIAEKNRIYYAINKKEKDIKRKKEKKR